jgi:YfiH family protein
MSLPREWLVPDWPVASRVRAFVTTRAGGVSGGEYASMNLGNRSGDDEARVAENRRIASAHMPSAPRWMAQVHGAEVADLDRLGEGDVPRADAAMASTPRRVAAVLTADCLPVFLAERGGKRVAVAHAGWRGLAAGVLENTVAALGGEAGEIVAWMGPAIGPGAFEVGAEVKEAFERVDSAAASAFKPHVPGKFMADLYALARQRLGRAGVTAVGGGGFCTYRETDRFFSYRRARNSGRMGAFIWIE